MEPIKLEGILESLLDSEDPNVVSYLEFKLGIPHYIAEELARRIESRFNIQLLAEAKRRRTSKPIEFSKSKPSGKISIYSLDSLSGKEFERFLKWLFEELGYQVQLCTYVADSGVDLVVNKGKAKIAVQAKRYDRNTKVSNSVVLKTQGGMGVYRCSKAIVVTTTYFTQAAVSDAAKLGIELWDRDILASKIAEINLSQQVQDEHRELPPFHGSLLEFLMALDRFSDFYVESKENGKYDVLIHGIRYPLVTFHTRLSHVSKCVLRFENRQPVGESDGRKLIWSDAHYTHGNQRDAYLQLTKYFSQFLE